MNPALLMQIIQGALAAVPALLNLYDQLRSGQAVTDDQVTAILKQYGLDRATLVADIAAEKQAGA